MEPMTQYDAAATPMWSCFNSSPQQYSATVLTPKVSLDEKNVAVNEWQKKSEQFNFAKEDSNNDIEFNRVLWHGLKGDIPFPGPKRAAFVVAMGEEEEDD
jgi:hypothetical protein